MSGLFEDDERIILTSSGKHVSSNRGLEGALIDKSGTINVRDDYRSKIYGSGMDKARQFLDGVDPKYGAPNRAPDGTIYRSASVEGYYNKVKERVSKPMNLSEIYNKQAYNKAINNDYYDNYNDSTYADYMRQQYENDQKYYRGMQNQGNYDASGVPEYMNYAKKDVLDTKEYDYEEAKKNAFNTQIKNTGGMVNIESEVIDDPNEYIEGTVKVKNTNIQDPLGLDLEKELDDLHNSEGYVSPLLTGDGILETKQETVIQTPIPENDYESVEEYENSNGFIDESTEEIPPETTEKEESNKISAEEMKELNSYISGLKQEKQEFYDNLNTQPTQKKKKIIKHSKKNVNK